MSIPILVVYGVLALLICRPIYRLTLHPLSKIPGPFWNGISSWPDYFAAVSGDRHVRLWQLHEIYGPVVRIAPNRVSFNTITAFKTIYDAKANVEQGRLYKTFIASNRGRVDLLDAEGPVHTRKRKIISRAFSEKALRLKEGLILEYQDIWFKQVMKVFKDDDEKQRWTKPIDMTQWLYYMATDIVSEIGFGRKFDLTTNERFRFLPRVFVGLVKTNFGVGHLPPPLQAGLNTILRSPIMGFVIPPEVSNFVEFIDGVISERISRELYGNTSKGLDDDFVGLFRNDDGTFNDDAIEEIKSEATTLIVAGSDTASTAMAGVLFYLTHNPRCLQKLKDELHSTFSSVQNIRRDDLPRAKYLRACIDETLRMSPPSPGYLARQVLNGGITVDRHHIPAGAEVGVPIYGLNLNSEYYPRPFEFWPERWLQDDGNTETGNVVQDPTLARAAFATFSRGRHGCVGKELALLEISLFIARLVYQYDIKLSDDETKASIGEGQGFGGQWGRRIKGQFQIEDHFTGEARGLWIQLRKVDL